MNLLNETLEALRENGKIEDDVLFVESFPLITDWDSFKRNANFNYDNGFGCTQISINLKIVDDTWWLERYEYDGSEWWDFKTHPHEIMKMIRG